MKPQTELEALLAVEIAAIGFAGHKFLRQSQHHLDEVYIGVYGNYAIKLLRLQLDMIQALDRHRRGNKQTVEVRHVHIHSGVPRCKGRTQDAANSSRFLATKSRLRAVRDGMVAEGVDARLSY
jgi:hypothetical protein